MPTQTTASVKVIGLVDEGHRGASSEANKWLGYRAKLAETGFTFEYSATFGQAMTAARDDEMTKDYGKAILFDYSYKYFYGDGFGKYFEVLNLRKETNDKKTKALLLANLLSYFEQKRAFQTGFKEIGRYHLADPLWIFVGSTVNTNKQAEGSDVLKVVKFLDEFLRNEKGWVEESIGGILSGKSGLHDDAGHDLFAGRFSFLKSWSIEPAEIRCDLLRRVFHANAGGTLHVVDIKGKLGELGLKVGESSLYFGLIYIGDTASFKNLIISNCPKVSVEEDQIAEGLFEDIKQKSSSINVLIGAKKFMQGWDSWRVTNMGLLNIGRSEGSEIIQLFGRGVRLLGLNRSLKRSSFMPGYHPNEVQLLEKLNIFAIRADYMTQFRQYLEREGVDPEGELQLPLPIKRNDTLLKENLFLPRVAAKKTFAESERILLERDSSARVVSDFSTKLDRLMMQEGGVGTVKYSGGIHKTISHDQLHWLDFEQLYLAMVEFKNERGFHNLVIRASDPKEILTATEPALCQLICDDRQLRPTSLEEVKQLQLMAATVLKKYVVTFYRKRQQKWETDRLRYEPLTEHDPNFQDYTVKLPRSAEELINNVRASIAKSEIYEGLSDSLPALVLDRHLYQPLLIKSGSDVKASPPLLNPGEERFVRHLIRFCQSKPKSLEGKQLFLLRNLSRGKGIGFFERTGFFPDFLLWIKGQSKQRLVFVEPHGLLREEPPQINPKVNLHKRLKAAIRPRIGKSRYATLSLDSYIVSVTPYDELRTRIVDEDGPWSRNQFAHAHIVFFEDDLDYLSVIVSDEG